MRRQSIQFILLLGCRESQKFDCICMGPIASDGVKCIITARELLTGSENYRCAFCPFANTGSAEMLRFPQGVCQLLVIRLVLGRADTDVKTGEILTVMSSHGACSSLV